MAYPKTIIPEGTRFGRLTVVPRGVGSGIRCLCDCGNEKITSSTNLVLGRITSCGCGLARAERRTKHSMSHTKSHRQWTSMRQRCENPNNPSYPRYGGRGIAVCDRWQEFANFYADMGDRPSGKSIDRIDQNGPYSPENCRWASTKDQARNMRSNRMLSMGGETYCIAEWSERTGIATRKISQRLSRGWPVERALAP